MPVGILILQPSLYVTPGTTFGRPIFNPVFDWRISDSLGDSRLKLGSTGILIATSIQMGMEAYLNKNSFEPFFLLNFSMYSDALFQLHSVILSNQHMHCNPSSFMRSVISHADQLFAPLLLFLVLYVCVHLSIAFRGPFLMHSCFMNYLPKKKKLN